MTAEEDRGSSWSEWQEGGYRGPPPWRRGLRPWYLLTSVALLVGLLVVFWFAFSGRTLFP